jgi:hypothetical protein
MIDIYDLESWEQLVLQGAEDLKLLSDKELKKSRFIKKLVSTDKIFMYSQIQFEICWRKNLEKEIDDKY